MCGGLFSPPDPTRYKFLSRFFSLFLLHPHTLRLIQTFYYPLRNISSLKPYIYTRMASLQLGMYCAF